MDRISMFLVMASSITSGHDEGHGIFDMGSLGCHLPQKRKGLSNYFSGKSQSFACLSEAKTIVDLEKAEIPEAKRRKYSERRAAVQLPALERSSDSSMEGLVL